ncbi:AGE family epimerase/isomerase, partial [Romboutsia ilealis]|nr:AGE family epimerase/isomerase [Romboutsia ilealis]
HRFCRDHFYDPEYGEWYSFLNRDGSVKSPEKGSKWKCAFHVLRALVFTYEAMQRADQREKAIEHYTKQ